MEFYSVCLFRIKQEPPVWKSFFLFASLRRGNLVHNSLLDLCLPEEASVFFILRDLLKKTRPRMLTLRSVGYLQVSCSERFASVAELEQYFVGLGDVHLLRHIPVEPGYFIHLGAVHVDPVLPQYHVLTAVKAMKDKKIFMQQRKQRGMVGLYGWWLPWPKSHALTANFVLLHSVDMAFRPWNAQTPCSPAIEPRILHPNVRSFWFGLNSYMKMPIWRQGAFWFEKSLVTRQIRLTCLLDCICHQSEWGCVCRAPGWIWRNAGAPGRRRCSWLESLSGTGRWWSGSAWGCLAASPGTAPRSLPAPPEGAPCQSCSHEDNLQNKQPEWYGRKRTHLKIGPRNANSSEKDHELSSVCPHTACRVRKQSCMRIWCRSVFYEIYIISILLVAGRETPGEYPTIFLPTGEKPRRWKQSWPFLVWRGRNNTFSAQRAFVSDGLNEKITTESVTQRSLCSSSLNDQLSAEWV